jgi:hypothetical protein
MHESTGGVFCFEYNTLQFVYNERLDFIVSSGRKELKYGLIIDKYS